MATTNINDTSIDTSFSNRVGGYDYDAIRRFGEKRAEELRRVSGLENVSLVGQAGAGKYNPTRGIRPNQFTSMYQGGLAQQYGFNLPTSGKGGTADIAKGAAADAKTQAEVLQQQANAAADALQLRTQTTIDMLQRFDTIGGQIEGERAKMSDYWSDAIAYADQAVGQANLRMGQVMDKLDQAISQVGTNLDFATSHAIQVQAAGALGEMRQMERNIVAQFGRDSAEYSQFKQSKAMSMHVGISNVHTQMAQLRAQIDSSLALGRGETATAMAQLVNYQEKGALDARVARAQSESIMGMQALEMEMRIEQLKATGLEGFLNAATAIGGFSFEALPFLDVIANAQMEQQAAQPISGGGIPRVGMPNVGNKVAAPKSQSQPSTTQSTTQTANSAGAGTSSIQMGDIIWGNPGTGEGATLQNQSAYLLTNPLPAVA